MFKSILVPIDGSDRAREAVRAAVEFARDEHARIIGFYPLDLNKFRPRVHAPYLLGSQADLEREIAERIRQQAENALHFVEDASRTAGVPCTTLLKLTAESPHEAIVREAEEDHCDLIFMASDAHRGIEGWIVPSEATKVMTNAKIPVMLYRH